jgi:cystathionine beta-synthase
VPRNAARSLRYMDDYVLVNQGEVFYITELLAKMEGIERGPAGNTSVTGAVSLAREMDRDQIIVVQETEYTGAGKHHNSQLAFARSMGIEVRRGDPREGVNGRSIVIPETLAQVHGHKQDMEKLRLSYLKNAVKQCPADNWSEIDKAFVVADVKKDLSWLEECLNQKTLSAE